MCGTLLHASQDRNTPRHPTPQPSTKVCTLTSGGPPMHMQEKGDLVVSQSFILQGLMKEAMSGAMHVNLLNMVEPLRLTDCLNLWNVP